MTDSNPFKDLDGFDSASKDLDSSEATFIFCGPPAIHNNNLIPINNKEYIVSNKIKLKPCIYSNYETKVNRSKFQALCLDKIETKTKTKKQINYLIKQSKKRGLPNSRINYLKSIRHALKDYNPSEHKPNSISLTNVILGLWKDKLTQYERIIDNVK